MSLAVIEGGKTSAAPAVGSKEWAERLRSESKALSGSIENNYLQLARNLFLLFDMPAENDPTNSSWVSRWGYGYIGEFAEKELGIDKRIADRLRRMWRVIGVECKDAFTEDYQERIIKLGRSKTRLITRPGVMDNKNARSWVEKAEKLTYMQLDEEVNAYLAGRAGIMKGTLGKVEATDADGDVVEDIDADEPEVKGSVHIPTTAETVASAVDPKPSKYEEHEDKPKHYKTFAMYDDQWDTLNAALERAQELSSSKVDSNNLSLICLDFLATNEFKKASMEQIQRFLKRIEKALSVKLIALSPKDHEILYGYKVLDKVINSK